MTKVRTTPKSTNVSFKSDGGRGERRSEGERGRVGTEKNDRAGEDLLGQTQEGKTQKSQFSDTSGELKQKGTNRGHKPG